VPENKNSVARGSRVTTALSGGRFGFDFHWDRVEFVVREIAARAALSGLHSSHSAPGAPSSKFALWFGWSLRNKLRIQANFRTVTE
jgi:hypothetical protein